MAAKKKASKKKVVTKGKNVDNKRGKGMVTKEVEILVDAPDEEAESVPPPAIEEERTLKVVDHGAVTYYTQSQYDAKFGKAK